MFSFFNPLDLVLFGFQKWIPQGEELDLGGGLEDNVKVVNSLIKMNSGIPKVSLQFFFLKVIEE